MTASEFPRQQRLLWIAVAFVGILIGYAYLRDHPALGPLLLDARPYHDEIEVMHTVARLTIVPTRSMRMTPEEAAARALEAVRAVEQRMNAHDPQSDIGRLNDAPAGALVSVDPLTWGVMMEALRYHRLTGGAFDVTVGPLLALYRYENKPVTSLPPAQLVRETRARVGSDKILFEREGMKLGLRAADMRVDLGAIAKGFAVDQAMAALQDAGVENALVEIGGEIRLIGEVPLDEPNARQQIGTAAGNTAEAQPERLPARPWRTGIRHPRDPRGILEVLERTNCAIATSGDYEKYFEFEGARYSHIVDPRTGWPLRGGVVSATVIHPTSCLRADALATAFSVMGVDATRKLLAEIGTELGLEGESVILVELQADGSLREVRMDALGVSPAAERENP